MSEKTGSLLKRSAVAVGVGLAIALGLFYARGGFSAVRTADRLRLLSDAFFVPGLLMVFFGLIFVISNDGFFYGLGYIFIRVKDFFIPGVAGRRKIESYGDYVARKREDPPAKGYSCLFISGGILLLVAIILMIAFYQV